MSHPDFRRRTRVGDRSPNGGERPALLSYRVRSSADESCCIAGGLLTALLLGLLGCSSDGDWPLGDRPRSIADNVNVVYDPDVDFSQYQTFAFRDDADTEAEMMGDLEPAARRELAFVNERIAIELRDLGLIEVAADEADLLAFSLGRVRSGTGVSWSCVGGVWGGYWVWDYYYYDPCAWLEPVYFEVDQTTLMVGLLDPDSEEVAFAGFIRGLGAAPRDRSRRIAAAVDDIFARYPARPAAPTADGGALGADAGAPTTDDAGAPPFDAGASDAGADGGAP